MVKDHLKKPHFFEDDSSPKKEEWLRESQITIKLEKDDSEEKDIRSSNKSAK